MQPMKQYWRPRQAIKLDHIITITDDYNYPTVGGWTALFDQFLREPNSRDVTALVVGEWLDSWEESSAPIVEALVVANEKLPHLRILTIGEYDGYFRYMQSDMLPIFHAYPELQEFTVCGSEQLSLGNIRHAKLEKLVIHTHGLDRQVVRQICTAQLPNLRHLDIWLGDESYGWNGTIDDLLPLFSGEIFPKLEYLGLCNSSITDEIATTIARAPVMRQLKMLDLSLGTLGDEGAKALLASPYITSLERLNLSYHYCSEEIMAQFEALPIEVDLSEGIEVYHYDGKYERTPFAVNLD
jgi:hypothetical protein